jgi:hypothetical protein
MRAAIKAAIEGRPLPIDQGSSKTLAERLVGEADTQELSPCVSPLSSTMAAPESAGTLRITEPPSGHAMVMPPAFGGPLGSNLESLTISSLTISSLGTEAPPRSTTRTSAAGLAIGAALAIAGAAAFTLVVASATAEAPTARVATAVEPAPTETLTSVPAPPDTGSVAPATPEAAPSTTDAAPTKTSPSPRREAPVASVAKPSPEPVVESTSTSVAAVEPPPPHADPVVVPAPPPRPPIPQVAPPRVAPSPPPFSAAACHATVGIVRSNGAVNANTLRMSGTAARLDACAKTLARPPSGTATVNLDFRDDKRLRNATCKNCPAEIQQCVLGAARSTASLQLNGEITGEPAFDVAVTFSCEP